ncbi:hypothetical protein BJ138DRAFT_1085367 [Hygrophoropsis aurantiaca]|uniref:Uncharacterized protein n=1 Tax=Hygrophoropsis aurantiaca TaxID=72124 RepID=A0ACB8AEI4_9AGAM|nr:hypothetical protein BJ138DRAFT_1085367 [Hygrophoropsis aurantiaca]
MTTIMPSNSHEPEPLRQTRKTENRFYAFFRSRSRSRTKPTTRTVSSEAEPLPVTKPHALHIRHSSLQSENSYTDQQSGVASTSKPSTRSQSRPISSTTTATHSTIAPLPSDTYRSRSKMTRSEYVHNEHDENQIHDQNDSQFEDHHDRVHRPDTPSTTRRKLGLHNIFGITLSRKNSSSGSTRKASSSNTERNPSDSSVPSQKGSSTSRRRSYRLHSRPNTPKASDDGHTLKSLIHPLPVPSSPLPLSASPRRLSFGNTSTSKVSSSNHLPSGTHRPYGTRRLSSSSQRTPHDSAVALPEEAIPEHCSNSESCNGTWENGITPNGKNVDSTSSKAWLASRFRSRSDERPATDYVSRSVPSVPAPIESLSAPPSPYQRPSDGYDPDHADVPPVPPRNPARPPATKISTMSPSIPVIPQIIHTPPTPQRPGQVPSESPAKLHASPSKLGPGKGKQREVVANDAADFNTKLTSRHDHGNNHQNTNVRTRARFSPRLFGSKDLPKEKEPKGMVDGGVLSSRALTHSPYGAPSVGPPRNMTSRRAKHGSFDFERPVSGLNRSNSTVNASLIHSLRTETSSTQLHKNASTIHRPHGMERTISSSSSRTGRSRTYAHHPARAESPLRVPLTAHLTGDASVASFSSVSAQSKSTGKGVDGGAGQSSSWGRAAGKRAQRKSHGAFSFERAATTPNSPANHPSALPISPVRTDFEPLSGSMPSSSPLRTEFGYVEGLNVSHSARGRDTDANRQWEQEREQVRKPRGKGKGRSLDLGLGLSWAPNRVREEAVMPGLFLSRANSRKAPNNRGRDVTKVFENVLSETGFEAFKKYVHRFDAHTIPLEGPSGLLSRVEKLLNSTGIEERVKAELLGEFATFVEGHDEYPA